MLLNRDIQTFQPQKQKFVVIQTHVSPNLTKCHQTEPAAVYTSATVTVHLRRLVRSLPSTERPAGRPETRPQQQRTRTRLPLNGRRRGQVTAEVTPEVTPQVTPEITPEVTPQVTREVTSEVTPEVTENSSRRQYTSLQRERWVENGNRGCFRQNKQLRAV